MSKKSALVKKSFGSILLGGIYEAVYPNKCLFCLGVLDRLEKIACDECDILAGYAETAEYIELENITRVFCAFDYVQGVRSAVFRLKYSGKRLMAARMAKGMYWRTGKIDADFLVPVPLHVKRLKQRGFNQAQLLAVEFGRLMELEVYAGLERTKETAQQYALRPKERAANVAGAFAVYEGFDVSGKKVLLVDDILTSGATAQECAGTLLKAGAAEVALVTFALASDI